MTTKGAIRMAAVVYSLRLLLSIARASLAHRLASAGMDRCRPARALRQSLLGLALKIIPDFLGRVRRGHIAHHCGDDIVARRVIDGRRDASQSRDRVEDGRLGQ